ncbi:MmgE/PrpD family protein [Lawsonibacter faecis]|uniref:MmgE/PrpD family protein n=1 Tax=Lawsonibacter faecis TaxID=2763052 RepID=A0A8J6MBY3_9FIRM|nr:MmgE/PrpD family protein [Lawsonibacter faecis]MBC5735694.1 MmgE/PrpD family protein [Lawsonibacter faecis]
MGFRVNAQDITTNYTQTLAEFTASLKYEDIPPEVLERAKHFTMQTIGVSLGAKGLPMTDKAIAIGKACGVGEPEATLWVDGSKVSMTSAVFANSTMADILDWEDCSWTGHPSAGVIPVAWAAAEAHHKSGKEFLTAVVAAYEVYQRIAMVVQPPRDWDIMKGWGLTSWQVFAGVVPAAKLMGLSAEQINQAFGFGVLCCPIQSNLHHITMSDAYHFEHGFRAKDGILAAMAAKAGVDNYMDCFDDTYSFDYHMTPEPQRDWYTRDLGTRWLMMEVLIKHWPANMWLQTPIELAHNITTKNGIKPEDIADIELDPPTVGRMYFSPEGFNSLTQAQFSAPFMLAAYLLEPTPGPGWFDRAKLTDPKILELAAKVHGGPSDPHYLGLCFKGFQNGEFPTKKLTITTRDGRQYSESMDCHPGHPRNMLTHQEFIERFKVQAAPTLRGERLERAARALAELEACGDIAAISPLLCGE